MYSICRLTLIATFIATCAFLAALCAKFGNMVVFLVAVAGAARF